MSLRQLLTVPYIVLVLLAAAVIGLLSYRAGRDAVDSLSDQLLTETVNRISQAVERHVFGSGAVLETAFPTGMPAPLSVPGEMESLRTRFWLATSVHRDPNNYAYYGDRRGQFFGLWRFSDTEAELRLRRELDKVRSLYRFTGIRGELKDPVSEDRVYDPRERPWYKAGQSSALHTWTSIYIDFKTLELVATRARRVNNSVGEFEGVVATDLTLQHLTEFLRKLKLSANGFAFIVENDGNFIATSRGPHLRKSADGRNERLNAAASDDPLIVATYAEVRRLMAANADAAQPRTGVFTTNAGQAVQVGYSRVRDVAGLDWIIAVAVPREDFLHKVTESFRHATWLAIFASILIAVTGFLVLGAVAKQLRQLANAARDVGDGVLTTKLAVDRNDEIGDLAKSFAAMQAKLMTDRLTGLANREAITRRVEDRIMQQRRRGDPRPFVVMFVDLNRFKQINDRFGHEVGDRVLQELAQRMLQGLRANDMVARFAGDEFVVLLDQVDNRRDAESARAHLERLLLSPLSESSLEAANLNAGAAIGIAMYPDDGQDVETLIKHADEDMYRRKPGGSPAPG